MVYYKGHWNTKLSEDSIKRFQKNFQSLKCYHDRVGNSNSGLKNSSFEENYFGKRLWLKLDFCLVLKCIPWKAKDEDTAPCISGFSLNDKHAVNENEYGNGFKERSRIQANHSMYEQAD